MDECLLPALALGGRGAVGSSYNFAAPIYHRLWRAFERGDWELAREEQWKSVRLIQLLASFGYVAAAKGVMTHLGVPVGQPRLPNGSLTDDQRRQLLVQLEALGFFSWLGD